MDVGPAVCHVHLSGYPSGELPLRSFADAGVYFRIVPDTSVEVIAGTVRPVPNAMASFWAPPPVIEAKALASVPPHLLAAKKTEWLPGSGIPPKIFLEGPITDAQGNLFMVDVGYGRILRLDLRSLEFSLVADYDGEPNGLALREDGKIIIADYKQGMLLLDPSDGDVSPLLSRRNMERFKGPNDVIVAKNGDVYFTDQGQTGMSDQSGHVYRLSRDGKLDYLLTNESSMTRENSVWRCPLHNDGTTTKVGKFFQSFGIAGPDGLTLDSEGNLFICHPSLLSIFVVDHHGRPVARITPPEGHGTSVTNCIFGSRDEDRNRLYFTDSTVGRICYVDWHCPGVERGFSSKTA